MHKVPTFSNKFLFISLVIAFAVISLFGLWNHYNTEMNGEEMVNTCSFVAQPCDMNLTQHIAMWKSFFTAPPNISYLTFLLLFAVLILSYFSPPQQKRILKTQQYLKYDFVKLFNYLVQAFSQGILNPKVY